MKTWYVAYYHGIVEMIDSTKVNWPEIRATLAELWIGPLTEADAHGVIRVLSIFDPAWQYGGQPLSYLDDEDYFAIVAAHMNVPPPAGRCSASDHRNRGLTLEALGFTA